MRYRALDSIRGVAAILVALVHLTASGYFYDVPIIRHGGLAVPLFFVLSGFVMAETYEAKLNSGEGLRRFFIRRFGRVYPLHFAMLMALVLLELVKLAMVSAGVQSGQAPFTGATSVSGLVASMLLLQAIIPFGEDIWNVPSWSLSVEFYVYILFATLTFFSMRSKIAVVAIWSLSGVLLLALDRSEWHVHVTSGRGLLQCIFGFMGGGLSSTGFSSEIPGSC